MPFPSSELILNSDGSIYHLNLHPGDIASDIITVGDTDRVDLVARHLDKVELTKQNREFKTVTGSKNGKRITIISTGIGTDNIDIVFNELDTLVNVDLKTREIKSSLKSLNFYRIGTSGTIREDIPVDTLLISMAAIDMGNLSKYYSHTMTHDAQIISKNLVQYSSIFQNQSVFMGSMHLSNMINGDLTMLSGITITAPGFYGPQGRQLRLASSMVDFRSMSAMNIGGLKVTNLEMETAGIYMLANLMGHHAISANALLANRLSGEFSQKPQETINTLIETVVAKIVD